MVGALAATLLVVSGCGVGMGERPDAEPDAAGAAEVAGCEVPEANRASGPIEGEVEGEITFQTLGLKGSFEEFFTDQIARFEAEHPGVTVTWIDDPGGEDYQTRLATDIRVCKLADVINADIQGVAALANTGLTMDMADRLPDVKDIYTEDVWNSAQSPSTGEISALPWYTGVWTLMYNKDLMAKAGIAKMPTTYDEYFDILDTVAETANGEYYADWGNPLYWLPSAFAFQGVDVMNDDHSEFTFASDETAIEWLTKTAEAYQTGAFPADSISGSPNPSEAYNAGTLLMGRAALRAVQSNAPALYENSGVAAYMFDELGGPVVNGQFITVPKTSKNAATALEFAKFITSVPEQEAWCSENGVQPIPAMATLPDDADCWENAEYDPLFKEYMRIQRDEIQKAKADPVIWYWTGGVSAVVVPEIQLAMQGEKSPEDALEAAQTAANKVLASVGSK